MVYEITHHQPVPPVEGFEPGRSLSFALVCLILRRRRCLHRLCVSYPCRWMLVLHCRAAAALRPPDRNQNRPRLLRTLQTRNHCLPRSKRSLSACDNNQRGQTKCRAYIDKTTVRRSVEFVFLIILLFEQAFQTIASCLPSFAISCKRHVFSVLPDSIVRRSANEQHTVG